MNNPPSLQDYLPASDQISLALISSTRQQLVNYLSQWWPQLDTRPNSVFGDLVITPCAVLIAAHVVAEQSMFSDLQLSNIASGIINNTPFVTAYLKNFGVSAQAGASATGTMQMVFSVNQTYTFSAATVFNFGSSAFQINSSVGNPIIIFPAGTTTGSYILTPSGNGQFSVYIPVTGPSGAVVTDGTVATTNLTQTQLISITAAGDFNPGTATSTLAQLATQALRLYPAASLTSRRGAISFVTQNWTGLLATSATVTGDNEMIRASQNPLGINQSALDIFVRSQPSYAAGSVVATLTYNPDQEGWMGALPFPSPPAFFSASSGVFQASGFNQTPGASVIYAKSLAAMIDSVGVSFSADEQLGVLLAEQTPNSYSPAFATPPVGTSASNIVLSVEGEYWGNIFQVSPLRNIVLRFDYLTTINGLAAIACTAQDTANNITEEVYFVADTNVTPLTGIIYQSDPGYQNMFSGLNIIATIPGGVWNPATAVGAQFTFSFQGKTAAFIANYIYEPLVSIIAESIQNNDNVSVNTSVMSRSFIPCNITSFVVNYRVKQGSVVNQTAAATSIFNYVNSIAYPDAYEESQIGMIMMQNGASGVSSVTKLGMIYPSLASVYVTKAGQQEAIPPVITTDLTIPANNLGFGNRNVTYILPMAVITFNATVY